METLNKLYYLLLIALAVFSFIIGFMQGEPFATCCGIWIINSLICKVQADKAIAERNLINRRYMEYCLKGHVDTNVRD